MCHIKALCLNMANSTLEDPGDGIQCRHYIGTAVRYSAVCVLLCCAFLSH